MNIRCPNCQTVFRVDPARVPAAGVRARCARCSATFTVRREQSLAAPAAPAAAPPPAPSPAGAATGISGPPPQQEAPAAALQDRASVPDDGSADVPQEAGSAEVPQEAGSADVPQDGPARERGEAAPPPYTPAYAAQSGGTAPSATAPAPVASGAASAAPAAAAAAPRMPAFGSRDPDSRAKRVARALVSDIVAYHPARRDESLQAGTLRADFREEIMKSWEEYVAQVGLELARSTPHFRNALNDILARGQTVF
jgi:predicted Zn finger-like uncharacterized protein